MPDHKAQVQLAVDNLNAEIRRAYGSGTGPDDTVTTITVTPAPRGYSQVSATFSPVSNP